MSQAIEGPLLPQISKQEFSMAIEALEKKKTSVEANRTRHPEYYFEEGVVFLVENTYFKIPRRKLCRLSSVISDLFTLPSSPEGNSDENPILLSSPSAVDFERLLTYVYPLVPQYDGFTEGWSFDYWRSILSATHRFQMEDIRIHAINELSKLSFQDSLTKIQLGLKFDHPKWVHEGYVQLIQRSHPLTIEEAQSLGFQNAFCLASARENYRDSLSESRDPYRVLGMWFTGKYQLPGELPPNLQSAGSTTPSINNSNQPSFSFRI